MEPQLEPIPADANEPATKGSLYELKAWISKALGVYVDRDKLRDAVITRRDRSQQENADWEAFSDSPHS